jgi:hypothetical protein
VNSLLIYASLFLNKFRQQKFDYNGKYIDSVLLSQLWNIISFLFLFSSLVSLFLGDLSLVCSATSSGLTSKINNLYHVFELNVISETFKQLSVLS